MNRLEGLERPDDGAFDAPWQAQVFALTVALNEAGNLAWSDWADELSGQLHAPDAAQDGSDYYMRWAAALEAILVSTQVTDADQLAEKAAAWQRAARATPHGTAISLDNDPEG
ncbi:nitrile hydratase accessory protein [Gymnodinialimonas sp.]